VLLPLPFQPILLLQACQMVLARNFLLLSVLPAEQVRETL